MNSVDCHFFVYNTMDDNTVKAVARCYLGNIFLRPRVLAVFVEYWWEQLDFIDTLIIPHQTFRDETERRFHNLVSLFTSTLDDIVLSGQRQVIAVLEDNSQRPTGRIHLMFRNPTSPERQEQHILTIGDQLCISTKPWSAEIDPRALPLALSTMLMDPASYWEERIEISMNGHFYFTKFVEAASIGGSIILPSLVFSAFVTWLLVKQKTDNVSDILTLIKTCGTLLHNCTLPGWWWSPKIPPIEQTLTRELAGILLGCKTLSDVLPMVEALTEFHKKACERAAMSFRELEEQDKMHMPMQGIVHNPHLLYDMLVQKHE